MNELFYQDVFFLVLAAAIAIFTILFSILLIRLIVLFKHVESLLGFWKHFFKKIKK